MEYEDLDIEDFDAIVTGELTHSALWMETLLNNLIAEFFEVPQTRINDFKRLMLLRDGLNFQDKIEITRGLIPLINNETYIKELKEVLKEVESFKSWRNAMAHGIDVTDDEDLVDGLKIVIQIITRSGKHKELSITPTSHRQKYKESQEIIEKLENIIEKILKSE
ncbi:hypothetical protein [uncultured Psychroserpens sp.]|uniref:hypothetical protein n=1 Tax=uncultured Psychroserpens sp. TaxID=255436 RepID=UPI00260F9A68|nr:hypothetical protein [uncultured Psychroserpens sp.]